MLNALFGTWEWCSLMYQFSSIWNKQSQSFCWLMQAAAQLLAFTTSMTVWEFPGQSTSTFDNGQIPNRTTTGLIQIACLSSEFSRRYTITSRQQIIWLTSNAATEISCTMRPQACSPSSKPDSWGFSLPTSSLVNAWTAWGVQLMHQQNRF